MMIRRTVRMTAVLVAFMGCADPYDVATQLVPVAEIREGVPGIVGGFPKGEENRGGSRGPDSGLESGSQNPNRETTTMKRKYEKKGPSGQGGP